MNKINENDSNDNQNTLSFKDKLKFFQKKAIIPGKNFFGSPQTLPNINKIKNNSNIDEISTENNEIIEKQNIDKIDTELNNNKNKDDLKLIDNKSDSLKTNNENTENENIRNDINIDNDQTINKNEILEENEEKIKNENSEINHINNNIIENTQDKIIQNDNKEIISTTKENNDDMEKLPIIEEKNNENEKIEENEIILNEKEHNEKFNKNESINITEKNNIEQNKENVPIKNQREIKLNNEEKNNELNNKIISKDIKPEVNKENKNNIKNESNNINKQNTDNPIKRRIMEMQKLYKNKKEEPKEQRIFKRFDASFLEKFKPFRQPKEKKEKEKEKEKKKEKEKENNINENKNIINKNELHKEKKEIIMSNENELIKEKKEIISNKNKNEEELIIKEKDEIENEDKKQKTINNNQKNEDEKIAEKENIILKNEEKDKKEENLDNKKESIDGIIEKENLNNKKDIIDGLNEEENKNKEKIDNVIIEENDKINDKNENKNEIENNNKEKIKKKNLNKFQMFANSLNEKFLIKKNNVKNNEIEKLNEEKNEIKENKENNIIIDNQNNIINTDKENNINIIGNENGENNINNENNIDNNINIDKENNIKNNVNIENENNVNDDRDIIINDNNINNDNNIKNENDIDEENIIKIEKEEENNIINIDANENNNIINSNINIDNINHKDTKENDKKKNNEDDFEIYDYNNMIIENGYESNKEKINNNGLYFDFEIYDNDNIDIGNEYNNKNRNSSLEKEKIHQKDFNDLNPKKKNSISLNNIDGSYQRERTLTLFNINSSNNISLDNHEAISDEIFLEKTTINQDDDIKNDRFCECFFLSSFSKENGKLMDKSEDNKAECDHFLCSYLPAMQPEIIYKYPQKDIKGLEINSLAASICFTNGIKVCYEDSEDCIKTVKNYRSSFTNQVGERFFAVVYHFYLKMKNCDFENLYTVTPIKNKLNTYEENDIDSFFNDELPEEILNKLNIYEKMNMKENVYIPYCLCLISKYPFIEQMEKCLESIMISINKSDNEQNIDDLNKLITYIVKSIPAPPKHSKIYFPLPYYNKFVEIQHPYYRDITEFGDNPIFILNCLSANTILCLFKLLIFEQKILIIGKNNDIIAQIILNFVSLLYPFEWIHTYIPIMSEKMIKFLQSFLPFFLGMNTTLVNKARPMLEKASKEVFIVNVDEDKIELNENFLKINNKNIKTVSYIKKNYPSFPKNIENLILKELKDIKVNYDKAKENYDKFNANLRIKNLFFYVFVALLQDYKKYSYIIDDYPVFNSVLMIREKKNDRQFYKEFTSTQLFQMFIQKSLFKDKDKRTHFDDFFEKFMELKKKGNGTNFIYKELYNEFNKEYIKYFQIKKKYIIKPFFIKEFKKFEEQFSTKKNKTMKLKNISLFLLNQYEQQEDKNINAHGVLRENQRIIRKPIELNNDKDPKVYNIFLIPEKKLNFGIKEKDNMKKNTANEIRFISDKDIKMKYIANNDKELTEEDIDDIKDNIREIMSRIYKSDISKLEEDKKNIMISLKSYYGIDYFASILNTGNIKNRAVKIVIEQSYDFFKFVIFDTLLNIINLEENTDNFKIAVKLLKVCLCIKTVKNKKEIILSDELFCNLDNYSIFNNINFWKVWVEDDLTKPDIEVWKAYKDAEDDPQFFYFDEDDEDYKLYLKHSYDIIDDLSNILIKMKFKKSFIMGIITELIKEYVIDEDDFKKLMKNIVEGVNLYKTK